MELHNLINGLSSDRDDLSVFGIGPLGEKLDDLGNTGLDENCEQEPKICDEFKYNRSSFMPPMNHQVYMFQQAIIKNLHFQFRPIPPLPNNVSKICMENINTLANNHNLVIIGADKGGSILIQDTLQYDHEALNQLSNAHYYSELTIDPTPVFKEQIDSFLRLAVAEVLRQNRKARIMKPDKRVVLMNSHDYNNKIMLLLRDDTYEEVSSKEMHITYKKIDYTMYMFMQAEIEQTEYGILKDKWEKSITVNKSLDIYQDISLMTLDSILKCAFSCNSNCQINSDIPYIKAVYDLTYISRLKVRCFPYHSDLIFHLSPHGFQFRKACKLAREHTGKVIQQRKEVLKDEKELEKIQQKRYLDFLDILLFARDEDGKGLSDDDICSEVDTFMFEGHDTTASGISWILYCMAKYPIHQRKCREEILEVLAGRETVEWNDLGKLTYTTMVIKECMRLYPPVPLISRMTTKTMTFPDGRSVPAGTSVGISIYSTHRQPDIWEDPEVFDPLRFSPERSANRHSYAFVPFAAGGRNCIGQHFAMNEIKVAIALILARFELTPDPDKPPIKIPQMVLRSKNGIHLNIKFINEKRTQKGQ
ncbi:cytochrome P450 4B1-like [Protopterus annectens]|uniref:cytochrome P450 4B1-like n=1 Tax=Protopterus annectens TaxID=7888 RepID=UPI001CF9F6F1|nr:cytochrome P450 4B1-like [Protopterus annectens]